MFQQQFITFMNLVEWNFELYIHDKYLVQLIKHPILRIPNILFVYFLSIFSR